MLSSRHCSGVTAGVGFLIPLGYSTSAMHRTIFRGIFLPRLDRTYTCSTAVETDGRVIAFACLAVATPAYHQLGEALDETGRT